MQHDTSDFTISSDALRYRNPTLSISPDGTKVWTIQGRYHRLNGPAIEGADAVLSAVGPRGTGPTTVIQDSVHSITQAMHKTGTRRLLQVSGSIVADKGESPYMRYLIKPVARRTFLRHVCADMRRGEEEIRGSDLDWTIFRPPALNGKPASGAYRTAIDRNLPHGFTVSRADLAACMLAMLADPATVHRHVAIAS